MQINISFNSNLINNRREENNLIFGISWENDGISYPDKKWLDFGIIVLDFWIGTVVE